MYTKRLSDQIMILRSISDVRKELHESLILDNNVTIANSDILARLGTLYSLLDVDRIHAILKQSDVALGNRRRRDDEAK